MDLIITLVNEKCAGKYKTSSNFESILDSTNYNCLLLLLSAALSAFALLIGSVLKLPQIVGIIRAKSAKGLSVGGLLLETFNLTVILLYHLKLGNPISIYAECFALWFQDIFILLLVFGLASPASALLIVTASVSLAEMLQSANLLSAPLPYSISVTRVTKLFYLTIPLGWLSMALQIWTNWKQGSTGNLSPTMLWLGLICGLMRGSTILIELSDDFGAILSNSVNNLLGLVLLAQFYFYRSMKNAKPAVN